MSLRIAALFCAPCAIAGAQSLPVRVPSPDGRIVLTVTTTTGNALAYEVTYNGQPVIATSHLGLDPQNQPPLGANLKLANVRPYSMDDTYVMKHGKANPLRNQCTGTQLMFEETGGLARRMTLDVRVFNDGAAFRYALPQQPSLREVVLEKELTEFQLAREGLAFPLMLNGFRTSYEDSYVKLPLTSIKPESLVALPFLAEVPGTAWVAITEAHLENYAGLYLNRGNGRIMTARLAPRVDDPAVCVRTATPMETPWRVLIISDRPGALIDSNIVLDLAPASRISDESWIKPGKTSWSWWSGDYATGVSFKPGMNTETMKHYIDFSASLGLEYMLVDAGWSARGVGRAADITHTNERVDMPEILRYAKEKNVGVWLWAHWTSVDAQMDEAFPLFEKWGVKGVKIDFMDRDDQDMVAFYHRVAKSAAEHHLMIDFHGAYKPAGLRRYYPNVLTREGVMGNEYVKWSNRTTSEHNVTLAFTRMLAGPMDYTPGGFNNVTPASFTPRNVNPAVPTTRAHQVALYVVFESAFQMLCDYPEAYQGQKETDFLKAVPVTWDETRVLAGMPAEYVVIARRKGKDWYLGAITNFDARDLKVPLSFLGDGAYRAETYADAADAASEPKHCQFQTSQATRSGELTLKLAPAGGFAAVFRPAQ
jgi:alpha-glucosidase